jgi:8-oxo-dGTP pyrophosphatase MutT (NUDIX family)
MKKIENLESHFTATGFVLNKSFDKGLVIFHKKLQCWLPAGGHVDPGEMPHDAVVREVFEETGVVAKLVNGSKDLFLSQTTEIQIYAPIFVVHELISARKDVPEHMHYDFIYFLIAEDETLNPQLNEVEGVKWGTSSELENMKTTEATLKIYKELFMRCDQMR